MLNSTMLNCRFALLEPRLSMIHSAVSLLQSLQTVLIARLGILYLYRTLLDPSISVLQM